jgi:hypothetical protein
MTKKEALIKCRDHWQYLADTDTIMKFDYFDGYIPAEIPKDGCYCCEYDLNQLNTYKCNDCPLHGIAWLPGQYGCEQYNSTYINWINAVSKKDRKFWASMMVVACNSALKLLEK